MDVPEVPIGVGAVDADAEGAAPGSESESFFTAAAIGASAAAIPLATSTLGGLLGSFAGSFAAAAQSQPDPAAQHAEATPVNQSARVPVAKAVAV